jgi:hypothetical protein
MIQFQILFARPKFWMYIRRMTMTIRMQEEDSIDCAVYLLYQYSV